MRYFTAAAFSLLLLGSCSTSKAPEYFTLSSIAGPARDAGGQAIRVRRPTIPPTLDRPEMVVHSSDVTIEQSDSRLWSEPLDTMIERIFAEDLRTRLTSSLIVTQSSDVAVKDAYVIDIDIQRFGTDAQGYALIEAQAVIRQPNGKETLLPVQMRGAKVTSPESMARALSQLLGNFSTGMANALRMNASAPHKAISYR